MKIEIKELRRKTTDYLNLGGLSEEDSSTLCELVVEQELIGNQFSSIGELAGKHSRLFEESGVIEIEGKEWGKFSTVYERLEIDV